LDLGARLGEAEEMASPPLSAEDVELARSLRFRVGRVAMVLAILAMVGFWAWVFTGGPDKSNPDRLSDRAFVSRTAERCDQLQSRLAKLPNAASIRVANQRADVLDRANVEVAKTLAAIEKDAPKSGSDAKVVHAWFADWHTYLQDRRAYAKHLRVDPKAQFVVSPSPLNVGVDETIGTFADVNAMSQCETPGDVG
jgi:hypothetical protein